MLLAITIGFRAKKQFFFSVCLFVKTANDSADYKYIEKKAAILLV